MLDPIDKKRKPEQWTKTQSRREDAFFHRTASAALLDQHLSLAEQQHRQRLQQQADEGRAEVLSLGDARLLLPVSQPSLTFRDDFLEADMRKAFMTFTGDVTSQGIGIMLATHGTLGALDLYVSLKYAPEGLDFVVSLCGGIVVCCFLQLLCATKGTNGSFLWHQGLIAALTLLQGILNVVILGRSSAELFLARLTLIMLWNSFTFSAT